jgi:hypothetical protein
VKLRILSAIVIGVLLSSVALAQVPSRFDLSGNASFNGVTLPASPSSIQVRGLGWQTSGVTRISRWFALTSQFGGGYASADSIQLIGFIGPGTMVHYSMLAGPRITFPTRSRFSPFVEGLAGADRASTKLVSNGTSVTGREIQTAYAFGGGAQIIVSRHFGLNFEAQYFGTQHTLAFTGWAPSHIQIAAGIVIRMPSHGPQIAEQRPVSIPIPNDSAQPAPEPTVAQGKESEAKASAVAVVQPVIPNSVTQTPVQPQVTAASNVQIVTAQPAMTSSFVATTPAPAPVAVQPAPVAVQPVALAQVSVSIPQVQPSTIRQELSAPTPPVQQVQQTVGSPLAVSHPPAPSFAKPAQPVVTSARAMTPPTVQSRPQAQPMSLGEYARQLREKKQQEQQRQ